MPGGRPKKPLKLTDDERRALLQRARRPKSTQRHALRCRIILACGEGLDNKEVADRLGIAAATVGKWRERFRRYRMAGLDDEPRPGAPRKVTDRQIREVIRKTMECKPGDGDRWTSRSLAEEVGLSQATIVRIWKAFGLRPKQKKNVSGRNRPAAPTTHPIVPTTPLDHARSRPRHYAAPNLASEISWALTLP